MTIVEMKVIEESSLRQDYENVRKQHIRATSAQTSGRRVYIWVAVGFGILCVSQVILNVSLRLVNRYVSVGQNMCEKEVGYMCPQDWRLKFGCSCYYVSSVDKNWTASRQDCLDRGADLVIINSREEQAFLSAIGHRAWIGLTDRDVKGTWRWVDGTLLNTSYWASGEPNDFTGVTENCIEIIGFIEDPVNTWNDEKCEIQRFGICELDKYAL
ncbi:hypothetical protein DPEC_G00296590 [Dallia pectoralis]|uniref:Uncharacterized protein n=1 Tax=Dallia pectoralis TaxID=75939 RepID=A0ACC2FFC2_DALPE|nr:hypothetical protein DPEC_G00296590 [Dallia pectoralis]